MSDCGGCRYWVEGRPYRGKVYGECRRNAPIVAATYKAKWPRTNESEWCGQWEGYTKGE